MDAIHGGRVSVAAGLEPQCSLSVLPVDVTVLDSECAYSAIPMYRNKEFSVLVLSLETQISCTRETELETSHLLVETLWTDRIGKDTVKCAIDGLWYRSEDLQILYVGFDADRR